MSEIKVSSRFTVKSKPKVTHESFYTLKHGDKEVGNVSAEFDLKNVPVKDRELIMQMIQSSSRVIWLPR